MSTRFLMTSATIAAALTASASAEITLSDFSDFNLSGTYVDWDFGTFTSGPDDFRVEATNFGGGWLFMDAPVDASGESLLEITITVNPNNVTPAFNVVLFSDNGATQAGFRFDIVQGTQTLTKDLSTPDFFNLGDQNSWNTSNIFDQWHLQGTFENGDPLDITFDHLALIPAPASIATLGLAFAAMTRRRRNG